MSTTLCFSARAKATISGVISVALAPVPDKTIKTVTITLLKTVVKDAKLNHGLPFVMGVLQNVSGKTDLTLAKTLSAIDKSQYTDVIAA